MSILTKHDDIKLLIGQEILEDGFISDTNNGIITIETSKGWSLYLVPTLIKKFFRTIKNHKKFCFKNKLIVDVGTDLDLKNIHINSPSTTFKTFYTLGKSYNKHSIIKNSIINTNNFEIENQVESLIIKNTKINCQCLYLSGFQPVFEDCKITCDQLSIHYKNPKLEKIKEHFGLNIFSRASIAINRQQLNKLMKYLECSEIEVKETIFMGFNLMVVILD